MADDNKPIKYLRYAIGEIVLVVIGILIALSINNWNESNKNKSLESKYLNRLHKDIKEDEGILLGVIKYHTKVMLHAKKAIKVFENDTNANNDPVETLIDMYQASQILDSNSSESTYKELIASGQINLIHNESLKTAMIRYYELKWAEGDILKQENNYRTNLRGKMPDVIQSEIRSKCGDIYTKVGDTYDVVLPEYCEISISKTEAQPIVDVLKVDPDLRKDLRFLLGNQKAIIQNLNQVQIQLQELIKLFEAS